MTYAGSHRWYQNNKERHLKTMRLWRVNNPGGYILAAAKRRAKMRGLEMTITRADVDKMLEPGVCMATGIPLEMFSENKTGERSPWIPSLDRKDSSKGYTLDNCQVVCWIYNCCKQDWGHEVVLAFVKGVYENNGGNHQDRRVQVDAG